MKKRLIGIDIIKVLAVIFVPSLHFFLNYGFYNQPYINFWDVNQAVIRWISFSCIGLFLMSTGYLQSNKMPNADYFKKIIKYVIPYLIFSFTTAIIVPGTSDLFDDTLFYFFKFPGYYWYMSFFFGFYLLMPYINVVLKNMSDKKQFRTLVIILVVVTGIPEFWDNVPTLVTTNIPKQVLLPNWWKEFFPITYYVIGAYFRRFEPKPSKIISLIVLLAVSFGISMLDFYFVEGGPFRGIGGGYGSIITVAISTCVFSLFYNVDMKGKLVNKVIVFISGITLEIYLGYIISDRITKIILTKYFNNLLEGYHGKLYFIEFPLNFLIGLVLASVYFVVICGITKIVGVIKSNRFKSIQGV